MATPTLGKAWIEVHANTKPFAKELGVEVEAIAKAAEPGARSAGTHLGREVAKGARSGIKKEAANVWRSVKDIFSRNNRRDRNFFQNIGASIGETLVAGLSQGAKGVGNIFTSIGSSVGNVGSSGPLAGVVGGLIVFGIPALIGLVIALIAQLGALVNVIGLLPGALSILGAAIVPIVVAFQGFGEALGAVLEGDPEKIAEAMKNLTPAARGVVREFQAMLPLWRELKRVTQENFFREIQGSFTSFSKQITPTLIKGFGLIATIAGKLASQLLAMASSPQVLKFLDALFATTGGVMLTLGPAIINLLAALAEVGRASLPTLKELLDSLARVMNDFSDFLTRSVANGQFDKFLDKFMAAFDNLWLLLKSGWNLTKTILGDANEESDAFLLFQGIIDMIDSLTEFFKSETGKKGIQGMINLAGGFLVILEKVVIAIFSMLAAFQSVLETINDIAQGIRTVLALIGLADERRLAPKMKSKLSGAFQGHAEGVVSDKEHLAMISEGNKREAVIPLTDPARARQLADESGLTQMLGDRDTQVIVYIGDEQVMARVERRVAAGFKAFGRNMKYGPRPVGV